jgi:hypothetical protein
LVVRKEMMNKTKESIPKELHTKRCNPKLERCKARLARSFSSRVKVSTLGLKPMLACS